MTSNFFPKIFCFNVPYFKFPHFLYTSRVSCIPVAVTLPYYSEHVATRIFWNAALLAELHAYDDQNAALPRFTLSCATLHSLTYLSSWASISPHRARRISSEYAYLQADKQVLSAADMTKFSGHVTTNSGDTERPKEEHKIVFYSVAMFGIVYRCKSLNSKHTFTWNVKNSEAGFEALQH